MVLVSNEWQNKCEDVPKTTANTISTDGTNTTTTSTPGTSTAASSADPSEQISATGNKPNAIYIEKQSETVTVVFNNSITDTDSHISTFIKAAGTLANDNPNNENANEIIKDKHSIENIYKTQINSDDDINECKIVEVEKLFTSAKQLKKEDNFESSVLNYNNSIKIMAESAKESSLKEEKDEDPQSQDVINNKYLDESNLYENSTTNNNLTNNNAQTTLQQKKNQQQLMEHPKQQQQQVPLSCPITPQAINTTNNTNNANNSVAATGLQPNFLSQLALTANVAGLQKSTTTTAITALTTKQLNQSFNVLDSNNQNKSDSNLLEGTSITSIPVTTFDNNGQAKIVLICESNSHPFQSRTITLTPNVECMVGRLIAKSKASENNAIFDCKVLSRKHAVIWYTTDGKFWVKDTKSSNGTFINDNKLGDEEAELHFGDIVKFGVDVLENSRKEVHGCIIACVKLYLPDGREAISIDSSTHRNQYSEGGRISYDELHRLNLYIQETTQREKVLTSKLCKIQNVLDATRKNSSLCWQSMITEDHLLHRIHSLEKKLQFMEKNVPENILRNEVLKLLDDKTSYQHTAKETLRKLYQERCEAMQMLAKMESAYTQSDNECSLLRDQIMNSKQTLQDVNTRLLRLETEYNEYKDEVARQQLEVREREEQRITMLTEKLRERELECEDLKKKISEILVKNTEMCDDEKRLLEKQAEFSENGNSEEDSDEDDDDDDEEHEVEELGNAEKNLGDNDNLNKSKAVGTRKQRSPPTAIMKLLQNSDIKKNEDSFDIFKAICNENDDEEFESSMFSIEELKDSKSIPTPDALITIESNVFTNFTNKLKNVQKGLKQLESAIEKETKTESAAKDDVDVQSEKLVEENSDEEDAKEGARAEEEFVIRSNGNSCTSTKQVLSKENKKYLLLKSSVHMLKEACNEIRDCVKEQEESLSPNIKVKTQIQTYSKSPTSLKRKFDNQQKLECSESDNTESDSEIESLTLSAPLNSSHGLTSINVKTGTENRQLQEKLKEYQSQVTILNKKLQKTELEAQHTFEILQVECDDTKLKMKNLNKIIEDLKTDKRSLESIIHQYRDNAAASEIPSPNSTTTINASKRNDSQLESEFELEEDLVLNAINVTALEREEELITYKERLDKQQCENILLRNEIAVLKQKTNVGTTKDVLLKQYLPCSIIVLAVIIYFLTTYY